MTWASLSLLPSALLLLSPACGLEGESATQQSLSNAGFSAVLQVQSDWGLGYCANVNITNGAGVVARNWSIGLSLKGSVISQSWNATVATSGDTVIFSPVSWNAVLNPGSATSLGFCANRPSGKDVPVLLSVSAEGLGLPSGNPGTGGRTTGALGGAGGSIASGGGTGTGGTASGGAPTGGRGMPATGGSTGSSTGGSSTGGRATGGMPSTGGGAGQGTGGTTNPGTGGRPSEDDGAHCPVSTLPDINAVASNGKLPDLFKKLDGNRIATKADWRCRREELERLAEKFAFGPKPARPQSVSGTVTTSSITVNVTDAGKSKSFSVSIKLPTAGSAPYPAIIVYGGNSFGAPLDSGVLNSEGVALINYNPYVVGKETGARNPKQGVFYDVTGSSKTGLLVAWSWGVSRILDVLEQDGKVIKADAIGVTGCSRFGKGSFIAGVFDERVALTLPIESGTGGVPLWRGVGAEGGQSLASAYGEQPWFGDDFSAIVSNPSKAPLDTHALVAMVAPRGLFIMDNPHIANLGPKSAHAASLAGAEVYKALGAGANLTYHSDVANGSHCSLRPEWSTPLRENIQKFLKRTGNAAGVIKPSAKATAKASDWIDWTTPTLN